MSRENLIFKLDNLEYQIHYLQDTLQNFQPRLPHTSKLYNVKGRKNQKRLQQKLSSLNEETLSKEIDSLKVTILDNKIHNAEKHLTNILQKAVTDDTRKKIKSSSTSVNTVDEFIDSIIVSKLLKLTRGRVMKMVHQRQLDGIPSWYEHHEFEKIWNEKTNKKNPSYVWNEIVLKIDGAAKFASSTMNMGKVKEIMSTYENGINVLLGIAVREPKPAEKKKVIVEEKESASEDDEDDDAEENISIEDDLVPDQDIDEDTLKQYDTLLADSDAESGSEVGNGLDNNINYNEVTDEEPSDDDDEEDNGTTEKKYNLPQLMNGYYSGDDEEASDLDEHEEKLVRAQTEAPEKKNRRGQRARRRIWAQKYGREANHVQREIEEKKNEREKRQREYEERVEKRAAKQAKSDKVNANLIPIANAKKMGGNYSSSDTVGKETFVVKSVNENHPSWVAKIQAEEKLKNAKFSGKKITFD
ncbi:Bud22p [Maudiozyma barnettii]|uniref:Similar to Saccharomyces cerevisiae YMR014W BUD22 Protein required for 18S rRNA maturation and small ribosomal subunit biogenesis n=1 Tax=Maudiozyma barnettii TaxID=61262 RepID=A0A8H2VJH7_9SACH|nr:Bud22p [Kazachstania barnettii]CAB4256901.1 similar to Saccharomyces cerevisiae YMR014W BUD22 Protein required for 18S rRNA maturation and small ribosomal subunit biogenesis [Kazachstania barnettii]